MLIKLPVVWALNDKHGNLGHIRQLLLPEWIARCRAIPYKREKDSGHLLQDEAGQTLAYLLQRIPKSSAFKNGEPVLIAKFDSVEVDELNLSSGHWLHHPLLNDGFPSRSQLAAAALESWRDAFHFVEEDSARGVIGLRRPQVGALHAIPPVSD